MAMSEGGVVLAGTVARAVFTGASVATVSGNGATVSVEAPTITDAGPVATADGWLLTGAGGFVAVDVAGIVAGFVVDGDRSTTKDGTSKTAFAG